MVFEKLEKRSLSGEVQQSAPQAPRGPSLNGGVTFVEVHLSVLKRALPLYFRYYGLMRQSKFLAPLGFRLWDRSLLVVVIPARSMTFPTLSPRNFP